MLRDYTAYEIANMTQEQTEALPYGGLKIKFANGEVLKCKTSSVRYSWFYWQLFAEEGTNGIMPHNFIGNEAVTQDKHLEMLSRMFWDVFISKFGVQFSPGVGMTDFWRLSRRTYDIVNQLYNYSVGNDMSFMVSLDVMDLINILTHPDIQEAKNLYKDGKFSADETNSNIYSKLLSDDPIFKENELAKGCRADIYSRRQIQQMVGIRGTIPDINGAVFVTPIDTSYAEGLNSNYDRQIESRTASIAYANTKAPLEDSQYHNRQCQLMGSVIRSVVHKDCGSQHAVSCTVHEGDLKFLMGKFHMVDGKPSMITPWNFKEEVGKTLRIRSITKCMNHDTSVPCAICTGLPAWTLPPDTALGHHLMIEGLGGVSQRALSTKHIISNIKCLLLSLKGSNARWLKLDQEDNLKAYLRFNPVKKNSTLKMRIHQDDVSFINDILSVDNLEAITPSRVTQVDYVDIIEFDESGAISLVHNIDTRIEGVGCPLGRPFLAYMKEVGWELVGSDIEVDITKWDFGQLFIDCPRRGEDIMGTLRDMKTFLLGTNAPGAIRAIDFTTPDGAIRALIELLSKKVKINFSGAEAFIRCMMSRVDHNGIPTYEFPRADENFVFVKMMEAIRNRSLGPALAFQNQQDILFSCGQYLKHNLNIPGAELDYMWGDYNREVY